MTLVWRPGFAYDTDASAYIDAVEVADGQALETATRYAINDFVLGCKQDGIWTAIKASCILSGARTLAGALVPLAGTTPPTNVNFVSGDYNRKTGLWPGSSNTTKYLDSNQIITTGRQNNTHAAVWCSQAQTSYGTIVFGSGSGENIGIYPNSADAYVLTCNNTSTNSVTSTNIGTSTGLLGVSRSNSSAYAYLLGAFAGAITRTSETPPANDVFIFSGQGGNFKSNPRLAFYSIGESLDLALLDNRVSTLIAQFGAVIP